jgi:hypothetical protein
VPEHERFKLALLLAPFAVFFLVIGVICGIDCLHQHHYRGPGWVIFVAIVASVHLASLGLVYLARWHRCHSHASVQGTALLITFLSFILAAVALVLIGGIH